MIPGSPPARAPGTATHTAVLFHLHTVSSLLLLISDEFSRLSSFLRAAFGVKFVSLRLVFLMLLWVNL